MFSKPIIVLAAAALAIAVPSRRDSGAATCTYVMTPSASVASGVIDSEFNYTIGRALAIEAPEHTVTGGGDFHPTANPDGSYTASGPLAASGWTSSEVKAAVTAWVGTTLNGGYADWFVDSIACT